ncbi:F-box/LRR-repeat protein 20-like [Thrips palmi]|uniref:F-box/LRR-repeat protein 20-like n=1 Tax=Thrips palmi TaxID=161013 RepID=A0A6P8YLA9_THRPL|nr:F-box/LRR-repeat protein 20-like [Thrips palmi]
MEDEEDSPVATLPPELLQHVFSFLDMTNLCAVADVCRKWRDLSRCASLWRHRHVDLDCAEDGFLFLKIMKNAPELASITVEENSVPGFSDIEPLEPGSMVCDTVRALRVGLKDDESPHYDSALALLRRYSPTVETLELGALDAEILHALAAARRLRKLKIVSPLRESVTVSALRAAVQTCGAIEDLDLERMCEYAEQDDSTVEPSEVVREFVGATGSTLRSLNLPASFWGIEDDVLDEVVRKCVLLESLGAEFRYANRLIQCLPRLRSLRLVSSEQTATREYIEDLQQVVRLGVGDAVPLARVEHLALQLYYVAYQWEDADYATALMRLCPRLQSLDLDIEGFVYIAQDVQVTLGRLRNLLEAAGTARTRLNIFSEPNKAVEEAVLSVMPSIAELTFTTSKQC